MTPEVSQSFHLDAVVCVVDGRQLDELGRTVHEARQLAFADVIVVTNARYAHDGLPAQHPINSASLNQNRSTTNESHQSGHHSVHSHTGDVHGANNRNNKNSKDHGSFMSSNVTKSLSFISGGEGMDALTRMSPSVTLSTSHPPSNNNCGLLSASTAATSPTPLLPEFARQRICDINPLVQIKELPPGCLGFPETHYSSATTSSTGKAPASPSKAQSNEKSAKASKKQKNGGGAVVAGTVKQTNGLALPPSTDGTTTATWKSGDVVRLLVGFNTYCAAAFDRLDLSGLLRHRTSTCSGSPPSPPNNSGAKAGGGRQPGSTNQGQSYLLNETRVGGSIGPSGVTTTVVFAEGRLMQRRFRDCMSALLRLCKEVYLPLSHIVLIFSCYYL